MTEPLFIEPVFQKDRGDCGICCLVMLLGQPYLTVVRASPRTYLGKPYNPVFSGMTGRMMVDTAQKFGVRLRATRTFDLQEDSGILTVMKARIKKPSETHAVLLVRGSIVDPVDGRFWPEVDVFLQAERYRTGTLLKRIEN